MMDVYFDNSATTCVTPEVMKVVERMMTIDYGNPSSAHIRGVEAERHLREARETIAATLHCKEKEIVFTSGGTESDNMAILGGAWAARRSGRHIITTAVEHAAVLRPLQFLEDNGWRVTYLPVDAQGRISLDDLREALDEETVLVSVMMVNNEMGAVQPVEEAAALVKAYRPSILFHVDAVQAYGKLPINLRRPGIDLLSVSGHKIHGPKGSGFLFVREKTKISPIMLGGGQQRGMRSGTDNVPGAAGLAQAAKISCTDLEEKQAYLRSLKEQLEAGLAQLDDVVVHSPKGSEGAPHIVNASFVSVRSEVMLHALEDRGICVSAGSACSTNRKLPVSAVLEQLHLPRTELESALRFSFSHLNTPEEVDYCLEQIRTLLPMLRRYTRR